MSDKKISCAGAKRFVNLHGHSTFSIGDAIGLPQDHIEYAMKNGADALALTDHGNMNGFSYQYLTANKLQKAGKAFKPIYGCEFYFVPSLSDWKVLKENASREKALELLKKKQSTKKSTSAQDELEAIGNEHTDTEKELADLATGSGGEDEDELAGTVVENEDDSKKAKWQDPVKRRNHLVVLAKNSEGLKTLFRLVSNSYADGFYMYPRIDLDMLRREAKGNLIALSACLSGDAKVETNEGLMEMKELIHVSQKREMHVLGFSEKEQRLKFGKVVWGACTRQKAKMLLITLSDGKKIRCTPDHKFLTNYGWLRADEIHTRIGTSILTY